MEHLKSTCANPPYNSVHTSRVQPDLGRTSIEPRRLPFIPQDTNYLTDHPFHFGGYTRGRDHVEGGLLEIVDRAGSLAYQQAGKEFGADEGELVADAAK